MGFLVFNKTDGIYASPDKFKTREQAQKFIDNFPKRFEKQGYYFTSNMERIDPKEVLLVIEKS